MGHPPTMTPERFAATYEQHLPVIVRYLGRRLGESASDDASAEVFIRAFRQRDSYDPSRATPLAWLYSIAHNVISEQRRAERLRLKTIERIAAGPVGAFSTHFEVADPTLSPRLAKALRKLSTADRDTLLLVAWGELNYEETASALGIPVGTVRSRLVRARRTLDRELRPQGPDLSPQSNTGEAHV